MLNWRSKFPYGILGKSACWEYSQYLPIEHTINCVATLTLGAKKHCIAVSAYYIGAYSKNF